MFCASFRVGITTLTEALPGAMAGTEVAPDDWIDIDKCLTHLASLHGFMFDQRDTTPQKCHASALLRWFVRSLAQQFSSLDLAVRWSIRLA